MLELNVQSHRPGFSPSGGVFGPKSDKKNNGGGAEGGSGGGEGEEMTAKTVINTEERSSRTLRTPSPPSTSPPASSLRARASDHTGLRAPFDRPRNSRPQTLRTFPAPGPPDF